MDCQSLKQEIEKLKKQLDKIEKISNDTKNYFLWFIFITAASIALPLLGLIFYIPKFIELYRDINAI